MLVCLINKYYKISLIYKEDIPYLEYPLVR